MGQDYQNALQLTIPSVPSILSRPTAGCAVALCDGAVGCGPSVPALPGLLGNALAPVANGPHTRPMCDGIRQALPQLPSCQMHLTPCDIVIESFDPSHPPAHPSFPQYSCTLEAGTRATLQ